jgi:DNA mismatch repair ATPase MutS
MPKGLPGVRQQYAWCAAASRETSSCSRRGACYELYDRRDADVAAKLGLKVLKRTATARRMRIQERLLERYFARLLGQRDSVVVVRQAAQQWTGIRLRSLSWPMVPAVPGENNA